MKPLSVLLCAILGFLCEMNAAPPSKQKAPAGLTLEFRSYDRDSKKASPADIAIQINFRSAGIDRSESRKIGEAFFDGKFKITKFEFKEEKKANGEMEEVSELTLVNITTNQSVVLALGRPKEIPFP